MNNNYFMTFYLPRIHYYWFIALIGVFIGLLSVCYPVFILIVLFLGSLAIVIYFVFRDPSYGIGLVLLDLVLRTLSRHKPIIEISSFNIFFCDIVILVFVLVIILKFLNLEYCNLRKNISWNLFAVFALLVFLNIARGLPTYGERVISSAREPLGFLTTVAYVASFKYDAKKLKRILVVFIICSSFLIIICYLRWMGFLEYSIRYKGTWRGLRVLPRPANIVLVFTLSSYLFMKISHFLKDNILYKLLVFSIVLVTIVSQVRTLWAVVIMGGVLMMFEYPKKMSKVLLSLGLVIVFGLLLLFFLKPDFFYLGQSYFTKALSAFWEIDKKTTLTWRIDVNKGYLNYMSFKDYLFGVVYAVQVLCKVRSGTVLTSPHNMFVYTFFYLGIGGLMSFLCLQFMLIKRMRTFCRQEKNWIIKTFAYNIWLFLILYQIVFLAGRGGYLYSIILGMAISMSSYKRNNELIAQKIGNK